MQASSELTKQLVPSKQPTADSFDVKVPLTSLKYALSLAGKLNQSINQVRRNFIKPSLPVQYAMLAGIADDSSEHLFKDSITDSMESLKEENQMKALLKKGPDLLGKRKHSFPQHSSNFKASSKTLRRIQDKGHYVKPISKLQQLQSAAQQYKERHLPLKLQLETKETLISFQNALQVKNFDLVKKCLQDRVKSFQSGTLKFHLKQWKELTSDPKILSTVSRMHIEGAGFCCCRN